MIFRLFISLLMKLHNENVVIFFCTMTVFNRKYKVLQYFTDAVKEGFRRSYFFVSHFLFQHLISKGEILCHTPHSYGPANW